MGIGPDLEKIAAGRDDEAADEKKGLRRNGTEPGRDSEIGSEMHPGRSNSSHERVSRDEIQR